MFAPGASTVNCPLALRPSPEQIRLPVLEKTSTSASATALHKPGSRATVFLFIFFAMAKTNQTPKKSIQYVNHLKGRSSLVAFAPSLRSLGSRP